MEQFFLIRVLVLVFCAVQSNQVKQPRISAIDNSLMITLPEGKHLSIQAEKFLVNELNIIETLNKAQQVDKVLQIYKTYIEGFSTRIKTFESRLNESYNVSNQTSYTELPVAITTRLQRFNRRISNLERSVRTMNLLLIKNECASNPCQNGGSCLDIYNGFICQCSNGWEGETCGKDVNECARFIGTDLGCQNGGTCINSPGSYQCQCPSGWTGVHCNRKPTDCSSGGFELCGHGTCISQNNQAGYKCLCDAGWTNENPQGPCTTDVNECVQNHPPCSTNPLVQCINVPGSYTCQHCPPGYTGNGYYCADINECEMFNGGCSVSPFVECLNTFGSSKCGPCPTGYEGDGKSCTYKGVCHINNGGCSILARCVNNQAISAAYVECICPPGYIGNGIGPSGCLPGPAIDCTSKPCVHGTCISDNSTSGFRCLCDPGFVGDLCQTSNNLCESNPCLNGGTCSLTMSRLLGYTCICAPGFTGIFCANELSACGNTFISENGTLSYPSKDFESRRFQAAYTCSWTILTDKTKILEVTFSKFKFSSPPCMQQYLEINDGISHLSRSFGHFCGSDLPLNGSFSTTQNSLNLLLIISRESGDNPEFELSWKSKNLECGGSLSSTAMGLISSPSWPQKYPNNRDCYWTYTLAPDKRMLFHIYALDIGTNSNCLDDYLEFYMKKTPTFIDPKLNIEEGDQLLLKLCNSTIPEPFYSLTSSGVIHFKSNHKDTHTGFQIGYSIENGIPGCGGVYTNPEGYIQSLELTQSMPSPLICNYQIKLPKPSTIYLEVLSIDLEEDCSTNIAIYVESSTSELLAKRCGSVIPAPFSVYGSTVVIKSTSEAQAKNLWKIRYHSVCQDLLTDQSGSISIDRERSGCRYLIQQPEGWIIIVDMTSFNNFNRKFINVYDGDNENARLLAEFGNAGKTRIESTTNYLLLVVKKTVLDIRIEANFTSINIGCGGLLKNKIGSIAYPSRNEEKYGTNAKCRWIIMSPPDTVIQLTFLTFHVEQSFDCSYDNLKIFDNNTNIGSGALIGTFCGYRLPPAILSSSNIITIDFTSDNSIGGDGFLISYNQIKESNVCGGNYFTPFGVIKSPGFPNMYPSNRECTWTITVDPGQQIMLKVLNFSLEAGEGYLMKSSSICRYDWLEVRNGGSSTSPLVGKYCGETIPKLIPSHANQIYLKFTSDLSRSSTGFMIEWDSATTGCGGNMLSPTGFIMSPQYPEPYPKRADCLWKIVVNVGSVIRATFSDVDLEAHSTCMLDYIELLDGIKFGSKSLGKFCTLPPGSIRSSSNAMLVRFRSDISIQGRGFQMSYMAVCNSRLTGFGGSIESPNFPNEYPQNQNCTWDIVVSKGNKINISFSDFDIESSSNNSKTCTFDWVEILYKVLENPYDDYDYDISDWTTYKRYCGNENPGLITLNSSVARVRFVSDSVLKGSGFRLEWRLNGCGGILQADRLKILQSPNYPKPYPMKVQCDWVIQSEFGQSVRIEFSDISVERDTSCSFDYVQVFNGPDDTYPTMGKFCHQLKSIVLTSTGKYMFVRFNSDFSYQGRGFMASYYTVPSSCGGEFSAPSGYIYSPNYPNNFNRNTTCLYDIVTDTNQLIELKFEDVDLIRKSNCSTNYIKVYSTKVVNGYYPDDPVLKTICGNTTDFNETIRSNYETLLIEFRSDYLLTSKGFKAHYKRACGKQLKVPESGSGIIDYRTEFFTESNELDEGKTVICSYTLESENPSDHIHLTITKMSKPEGFWCESNTSAVIIRNGKLSDSPTLGEYCTSKLPTPLISDGSAMRIEIYSALNFMATYSVLDTECGGELKSSEGYLANPGWPNSYPNATECTWTISAGFGNTINLNFLNFDIPFSEKCNLDYLEIRENNSTGKLIGAFCGNDPPSNVSVIGTMVLIFKSSADGAANTPQKGFYAEYAVSNSNKLYGSEGYISKGVSDVQFLVRDWLITTSTETIIELTFEELFLDPYDSDGDCEYGNSIKVYDGASTESLLLKEICTSEKPGPILSSSNMMFIQLTIFHRNEAEVLMKWKELPKRSANSPTSSNNTCGYLYDMEAQDENLVNLTSPGYPTGYAPNLNCEWIYTTSSKYHLAIKFTDISLGTNVFYKFCPYSDRISIYTRSSTESEWKLLMNLCGSQISTQEIHGSNLMKVVFITNKYINGTGFQASVRRACGGSMFDISGEIELNSNNNIHDNECEWNITVKTGRTIKLITQDFNLGHRDNGCKNYLMIRNGKFPDSPLLGKFCGSDSPNELESFSNHLYIKYSGMDNVGHFRIKYKEVSINCGGDIMLSISNTYEVITSPNYPNIPLPHSECIWTIRAPNSEAIIINFEENFDISTSAECENEYVELRDGGTEISPLIGRYCQDMPNSKVTTGNLLRVKYFTNSDEPRNGFKANVSIAECGGTFTKNGHILSREHQLKVGSECVWWIKAPYEAVIDVSVVSLNVGKARPNCTVGYENGYVLLYEVGDEANLNDTRTLASLCGQVKNTAFQSSTKLMKVVFKKHADDDEFALHFTFHSEVCPQEDLYGDTGTITSPGYPNIARQPHYCMWMIRVKKDRRITFKIEDADIASVTKFSLYDDGRFDSATIAEKTDIQTGATYETSSNKAKIIFWQESVREVGKFKITYTSDKPTLCVYEFNQTSGQIISPNITKPFVCIYEVELAPENRTLVLDMTVHINKTKGLRCNLMNPGLFLTTDEGFESICKSRKNVIFRLPSRKITLKGIQEKSENKLNYTIKFKTYDCGGRIYHKGDGFISSPNFPKTPEQSMECAWLIQLTSDRRFYGSNSKIYLNFTEFDLEDDCKRNFIEIYNGRSSNDPKIGKYCKNRAPGIIISQQDRIFLEYKYEYKKEDITRGFSLNFKEHSDSCGGIYQTQYSTIHSPGYGFKNYDNNQECIWEIKAVEGHMVDLEFFGRFFLEDSVNCSKDYIEVFDREFNTWKSLGKMCGRNTPNKILSSNNQLKIIFRSDNNVTGTGFQATWKWKCGGLFEATKEPKYLTNPGYYKANWYLSSGSYNCSYTIVTGDPQGFIKVVVKDIQNPSDEDNNCSHMKLSMKALGVKLPYLMNERRFCSSTYIGFSMRYKKGIVLNYMADHYDSGFEIMFRDDTCGGKITKPSTIEMNSNQHTHSIDKRGMYQSRISCTWTITAPKDQIVVFSIHKLSMTFAMRCLIQSLTVYDGSTPNYVKRLARLCGMVEEIKPIPSTSNSMLIVLETFSPRFQELKGEVYFTYGPSVGCGGTINLTETMYIQSPKDLPHMDCHWTIIAPRDYKVQLEFTDINIPLGCVNPVRNHTYYCTCTYIEARDGGGPFAEQMVKLCTSDNNSKRTLKTSWNTAYVRLYSAVAQNATSKNIFRLKLTPLQSECGKSILVISNEMQELTSPGYPNSYPDEIKCIWIIKSTHKYFARFMIHFEDFNLQHTGQGNCDTDRLQISEDDSHQIVHEGFGPGAIQSSLSEYFRPSHNYEFCGNDTLPFDYYSVGNEIVLTFRSVSYSGKKGRGFKLKYGLSGCNRTVHANEGVITSDSYNNATNCVITIIAEANRTISIFFKKFYFIQRRIDCSTSWLEIREGRNLTGKQLLKACGYLLPNPVFSDTNVVSLRIYAHQAQAYQYSLTFTSSPNGKGCGGKLYNYFGLFTSPMYPNIYRENIKCTWDIHVPNGYKVALKLKHFNIGGDCAQNKVVVTTYSASGTNDLTYCKGDTPTILYSDNLMNVTYYSSVNNDGLGWLAFFAALQKENDKLAGRIFDVPLRMRPIRPHLRIS